MSEDDLRSRTPEAELPPAEAPAPQQVRVQVRSGRPTFTYTIIGVTIVVFFLQWLTQSMYGYDLVAALGVKNNDLILQGQVWRLFTPVLLHANLLHIGFNMYALYVFGPELEHNYGHWQFLTLYVVSGFAGVVGSFAMTSAPSLGASTAVFGLLGALGVFAYQNRILFGSRARQALTNIVVIAAINLLIGLSPDIDNWGHLGGLIGGTLVAWFGGPVLRVVGGPLEFHLENRRNPNALWRASLSVFLLFAALTLGIFLFRM